MCDILSIRLLSLYIFENSHIYAKSMCNPIIFVAQNNYRTLVLFKNRRALFLYCIKYAEWGYTKDYASEFSLA